MSLSASVTPCFMSVRKIITSAMSIAICTCSLIELRMMSSDFGSMPAVSTSVNFLPLHSLSAYILSLVTPGLSSTIDSFCPIM